MHSVTQWPGGLNQDGSPSAGRAGELGRMAAEVVGALSQAATKRLQAGGWDGSVILMFDEGAHLESYFTVPGERDCLTARELEEPAASGLMAQ